MYSLKSIFVITCLAATSYGQEENCMPEGGYCLYGSCCAGDNTVCNPDTNICEKAAEPESETFNEAHTVPSHHTTVSMAAQTTSMGMQALVENDTCLSEYYAPCGMYDTCCDGMQCLNGGDPYHCQFGCWREDGCKHHEAKYGPMYCADLSVYGGFCRQR